MQKKKKVLSRILVISLFVLWIGSLVFNKSISGFLLNKWKKKNEYMYSSQALIEKQIEYLRPMRNKYMADLVMPNKASTSVLLREGGELRVLYDKNIDKVLPIASLTKLMTAWVVLEHYDLEENITISNLAAQQCGEFGKLPEGKTFPVRYFLYPLLMESSNGAAYTLAYDYKGNLDKNFVDLMNLEAQKMGLSNTFFYNPSGLDTEESGTLINYSTAQDLVLLTKELLNKPLIWEILSISKYSSYGPELVNTNEFLVNDWQDRIVGGKTGYTVEAGGCFLLVTKTPRNGEYLVNVVLGTSLINQRFSEMRRLLEWISLAYKW